jgi:hypothetical protein
MGRWCVQKNIVVVAKTVKKSRMEENMAIFDFALDDADLKTLDNMTSPGWFHCLHIAPYTLHPTPYTLSPGPRDTRWLGISSSLLYVCALCFQSALLSFSPRSLLSVRTQKHLCNLIRAAPAIPATHGQSFHFHALACPFARYVSDFANQIADLASFNALFALCRGD